MPRDAVRPLRYAQKYMSRVITIKPRTTENQLGSNPQISRFLLHESSVLSAVRPYLCTPRRQLFKGSDSHAECQVYALIELEISNGTVSIVSHQPLSAVLGFACVVLMCWVVASVTGVPWGFPRRITNQATKAQQSTQDGRAQNDLDAPGSTPETVRALRKLLRWRPRDPIDPMPFRRRAARGDPRHKHWGPQQP